MNYKFVPLLAVLLITSASWLTACQTDSQSEKATSISTSVASSRPVTDSAVLLLNEFRPFIQGVWVSKKYEQELSRTRSAEASWDALMGTPEIFLDTSKPLHDSLKVYASANNHEGDEFWLLLRRGLSPASLVVSRGEYDEETGKGNHWELAYRVGPRDTTLFFRCVTPAGKIKEETAYRRFFRSSVKAYDVNAVISLVRQKLYAGTYRVLYSTDYAATVRFETDGTLSGIRGSRYYEPQTDFMTPPGGETVQFTRSDNDTARTWFISRLNADTLLLHDAVLKGETDSTPPYFGAGPLRYRLLRQQ